MRSVSERSRLSVPPYRVEVHVPDQAAFIAGHAETPAQYQSLLTRRAAQLTREGTSVELGVIDQESDAVMVLCQVCVTPASPDVAYDPPDTTLIASVDPSRQTAKRRQVQRLRASPVGVCSIIGLGDCSRSRSV